LCMSVCVCAHQRSLDPDNQYLSISEKPAWALLQKLRNIPASFAHYVFRQACGLEAVPRQPAVIQWLQEQSRNFRSVVDIDFENDPLLWLDLGVASPYFGNPKESSDTERMTKTLTRAIEDADCIAGVGGYGEYRLLYDSDAFVDSDGQQRTMHLGIDIFMAAGSAVYAPLDGKVFSSADHAQAFDYGGCIILEHEIPKTDLVFYTLYGHLSPASIKFKPGDMVDAGEQIALLGNAGENGRWPPHLHFQITLDMLDETDNFFGAGSHNYRETWLSLCPDPNLILGIPPILPESPETTAASVLESRKRNLNPSLSLSHRIPIHTLRGSMQYLYDSTGRQYLDAVNNVPHVGHCHPRVVEAGARQARLLSTNTRYLYASITDYCERLLEKFPDPLSVCYLVNSGSEANDLALRLAKQHTARQDIVTVDHAYHGNLGSLIDISPYKHDGRGGSGRPANVHKARLPDSYRDPADLDSYVASVKECLKHQTAAFICESISGCGGQVVLPDGYLAAAYLHAREAGTVCIADEVQVGFGRVGTQFWGFQTQNVVPDIVTLGKPIGNGHPLAAVITTRDIANSFNNGMEYFNTFGGNPVSCAIGLAVLDVIEDEQLQSNALKVGNALLEELKKLQSKYSIIGDVRGLGLFIGVELVTDHNLLTPAAVQASYIAERMKQGGVLISTDGPFHNVLKIKPPMCFSRENADSLIRLLDSVLGEDFSRV
ncbi:MAG: aminotransferase class III-fold pyridoxal phosphate-dependent enzyme, partial [Gammaproteobacteria bacterium]|nr:aminotransferase class III-fold pyridoxal phosphate-dependent enzyme [Gammaproteobacteria bacterium]